MANRIIGRIIGVKVNKLASVIIGVAIGLSGCGGSGTNNDQGTSFLATGYGGVNQATGAPTGGGLSGLIVSIFDVSSSAGALAAMNFQNRLTSQFLRVDQISCSYEVPGSTVSLFQDSFNSSFVIPPATLNVTSGLITPSVGTTVFQLISRDVLAYFANRTNELPQFPFRMNVTCFATAIGQAGDVFQSNPLGVQVIVSDDIVAVAGGAEIEDDEALVGESDFDDGDDTTIADDDTSGDDTSGDGTSPL